MSVKSREGRLWGESEYFCVFGAKQGRAEFRVGRVGQEGVKRGLVGPSYVFLEVC